MSIRTILGVALLTLSFDSAATTAPPSRLPAERDVVATVNGTPIREADVVYKLQNDAHRTEMRPEYKGNLLEALIREELVYERAVELGLDSDSKYQEDVHKLEAQLASAKRKALGELFFQREIAAKAEVSDREVRKYFDDHEEWFRTEVHLLQILRRSESSMNEARAALAKGTSFDDVARGDSPPTASRPWDLGYVKLSQVPEPWQKVIEGLAVGETSAVIRGKKDRFWILKLVAKRRSDPVSFDAIQPALASRLKAAKIEELREATDRELRERARIDYVTLPATP